MDFHNVLTAKKTLFGNLLKPIFSIKHNLLRKKIQFLNPFIHLKRKLIEAKRNLVAPIIRPLIGVKKKAIGFARNIIDTKERIVDSISGMIGKKR